MDRRAEYAKVIAAMIAYNKDFTLSAHPGDNRFMAAVAVYLRTKHNIRMACGADGVITLSEITNVAANDNGIHDMIQQT